MILKNLIYILQSEGYYPKRFLRFAYSHLQWWKLENRQQIVWTAKALLIWTISIIIFWSIAALFFLTIGKHGLLAIPLLTILLPFIIAASLLLISPLDHVMKKRKINAAAKIIADSQTKVVGIAGSYGKTSAKEILATILAQKLQVIKTPENINTDIGIADFILKNKNDFKKDTIFIVEMGAYSKGEIATICRMVRPLYSILTGINASHLERFGSLENIIQGKFELPQNTRGLALLNFDDENIRKNHTRFHFEKSLGISRSDARNIRIKENFQGLEFDWIGKTFETSLLAEHNITLIMLCARIAQEFSLSPDDIRAGVKNLRPVEHRLQPIYNKRTQIMVIDDSYNGNFNGIQSGVQLLKRAAGRKVILTPGLVELGCMAKDIHIAIGELYAKESDLVLLIESTMSAHIVAGMEKAGFSNYKIYASTQEAHADLAHVLKSGDTIIFQNDLTDNYF